MPQKKPLRIVFDPACFANFEGTQEELDAFVAELTAMAESGELYENSRELEDEDWEELDDETKLQILNALDNDKKNLH